MSLQLPQAICQYVRRDSFVGPEKLLVGPKSAQHLHGSVQRTRRAALWTRLLGGHICTVAFFTCILQVRCAHCRSLCKWSCFRRTFKAKEKQHEYRSTEKPGIER